MKTSVIVRIAERYDALSAARSARKIAHTAGLCAIQSERVAIIVSELATNIARYSDDGHVSISAIRGGVCIEARDHGPPIGDFASALVDGAGPDGPIDMRAASRQFHTASGLGAVSRLSDSLEHRVEAGGNVIVAQVIALSPSASRY